MSRPEYCNVVVEKLPESKVLYNKIITSVATLEDEDHEVLETEIKRERGQCEPRGVTVECADGTVYHGHILVGDINSGVDRKLLYASSSVAESQHSGETGSRKDMPLREIHYHVSGITEAVDPQRIPLLKEDTTQLRLVLDRKSSLTVCSFFACAAVYHTLPFAEGYFCPTQPSPRQLTLFYLCYWYEKMFPVVVGCNLGR